MEGGLGGAHVPLMSDCNHKITKDYGVLIEDTGVAQRALFIIDPKGVVRCITVNDADVGRSVDEAQRVLDALVFKDEFGEGCPVDWKKGDKGIDTSTKLEGRLELKKSWSEWARPKLQRAWSGASQRSISSVMSGNGNGPPSSRLVPTLRNFDGDSASVYHSANHSGQYRPMLSPTSAARDGGGSPHAGIKDASPLTGNGNRNGSGGGSGGAMQAQMEEALASQRLENIRAAMENQGVGIAN